MPDNAELVYILDLDGTVLGINTFPRWVLYLARAPFPSMGRPRRATLSCRVAALLAGRKLGLIGHERFKWRLQQLWGALPAVEAHGFAERMARHVRPELTSVLAAIRAGRIDAVLATAAPADYADCLGAALGFTHVLATSGHRPIDEPGNIGERKRQAVEDFLVRQGWEDRPRIVFTDHEDDLPLIGICHRAYWFGSEEGLRIVARACPDVPVEGYAIAQWQDEMTGPLAAQARIASL